MITIVEGVLIAVMAVGTLALNVLLVSLVVMYFGNTDKKYVKIFKQTLLIPGIVLLIVGSVGLYPVNNYQNNLILADATELFDHEVELVDKYATFLNRNIVSDGVEYRTYREKGKIYYEEVLGGSNQERIIRKTN